MGSWRNARSVWKDSGTAAHQATDRGKEKDETSDRRTARKTRLCSHSQRIDQQSHGRVCWRSCDGHGRAQEAVNTALIPRRAFHRNRTSADSAYSVERRQVQRVPKCYEIAKSSGRSQVPLGPRVRSSSIWMQWSPLPVLGTEEPSNVCCTSQHLAG